MSWTVKHRQHEYIPDAPNSSTVEVSDALIAEVYPENLHFILNLGQVGVNTIEYELSLDAKDVDGDDAVSRDMIGPYRTDWQLCSSGLSDPLMAGMHTSWSGLDGEEPIDAVQIAGKDWLHYLERRVWPYDATLSYINWPDGFRFKVKAAEVGQIVKDVLETVRDLSANYPAAPDEFGPNPSYSLGFTVDADSTGFTTNYEITNFDSSNIYSLIQTLSLMGLTRGGFDFLMTWDKVFKLIYPEIGDPDSPIFTLEVDATSHIANLLSIGFTNTGPSATHVLGTGAGTSNQQGGINKHFRASSAVFRRLDKVEDFGNLKNLDTLEKLTSLELAFGSNPIHEIPIEVNPDDIPGFWANTRPGQYVDVVYDLGFHKVNSTQKIVSMDCRVAEDDSEIVQLSFNQFYDASDASGLADY